MSFGRLNQAQRKALEAVIKDRQVTDLGAGNCGLSLELLKLGAREVVAVDKAAVEGSPGPNLRLVQAYFVEFLEPIEVAFMSWVPNWFCPGLISLLRRAPIVVYLGKNTDGNACGFHDLFAYLVRRKVLAYVPNKANTLIIYGAQEVSRASMAEELVGLNQYQDIIEYERVEELAMDQFNYEAYVEGFKTAALEISRETTSYLQAKERDLYPESQDARIEWDRGYEDAICAYRLGHNLRDMMKAGIYALSTVEMHAVVGALLDKDWDLERKSDPRTTHVWSLKHPHLFEAVQQVEGDEWAEHDKKGGDYSLTNLLAGYSEFKGEKLCEGMLFEPCLFGHQGTVYGKDGVSRWVIRNEVLCLDGESTHEAKREKAKKLGFVVLVVGKVRYPQSFPIYERKPVEEVVSTRNLDEDTLSEDGK